LGKTWQGGRTLLTYEYGSTNALDAKDKSFTAQQPPPSDLFPAEHHSSFFTSSQLDLTSNVDIFLDGYYTSRTATGNTTLVGYTTYDHETARSEKYSLTTGTGIKFRKDWHADASLSWAASSAPDLNNGIDPSTGQVGSYTNYKSESKVWSAEAKVGGPIVKLGGGDADILLGTEARRESFYGYQNNSGQIAQVTDTNRDVIAGFAEAYLPFITERNAASGVQRLAVTAAGRFEKYSLVGSSVDPRIGVIYEPLAGLRFRSTYGTSFRAPGLYQLNDNITGALMAPYLDPGVPGGESLAIVIFGGTTALKPERSRNLTAGFDIALPSLSGLRASATFFSINFHDQIVTPFPMVTFSPGFTYFNFPIPVTRNITQAQIANILARAGFFVNLSGQPPSAATIFLDTRPINAAATVVNGIDYNLTYNFSTHVGSFHGFLGGTYLLKNTQQFTSSSAVLSELNLVGQPLRFKLRGGITYSAGAWDVTPFLNYVGSYHETLAAGAPAPVDAWTTLDVSIKYDFGRYASASLWKDFSATLVVQNAFNRNPPLLTVPNSGVGYLENFDPANADPRGRYLSLQLIKQWVH
jgi:iron complex outermembrane recepter protein